MSGGLFGGDFAWDSEPVAEVSPVAATIAATPKSADFCGVEAHSGNRVADVANVAAWKAGVELLSGSSAPFGLSSTSWKIMVSDARLLLQNWGADLHKLGWTTLEVFGGNPNPRHRRLDVPGLLPLLRGRPVEAVDADTALIRATPKDTMTFQRKLVVAGGVPVWDWVLGARQ